MGQVDEECLGSFVECIVDNGDGDVRRRCARIDRRSAGSGHEIETTLSRAVDRGKVNDHSFVDNSKRRGGQYGVFRAGITFHDRNVIDADVDVVVENRSNRGGTSYNGVRRLPKHKLERFVGFDVQVADHLHGDELYIRAVRRKRDGTRLRYIVTPCNGRTILGRISHGGRRRALYAGDGHTKHQAREATVAFEDLCVGPQRYHAGQTLGDLERGRDELRIRIGSRRENTQTATGKSGPYLKLVRAAVEQLVRQENCVASLHERGIDRLNFQRVHHQMKRLDIPGIAGAVVDV